MRAQSAPLIFALLLAGCAVQQGHDFAASNSEQIRAGITDRATVQQLLGEPLSRDIRGFEETWTYSYAATDATARSLGAGAMSVPFVGPLLYLGTMDAPITNEQKELVLTFKRGIVQTCRLKFLSSTMTGIAISKSVTREVACGEPAR